MSTSRIAALGVPLTLALSLAAPALAQSNRLELSPYGGWRWGGELDASDNVLFDEDVEIDASVAYGLRVGIGLNENLQIELLAARQDSEFQLEEDLFGEDRGIVDVTVDHFHLGLLFQGGRGQVLPFGVVSVGVGRLDPDFPGVDPEERLAGSLGGGVKVYLSRNIGFRFEGRFYWIDTEEDDRDDCCDFEGDDDLYQGEVSAGLVVGF